MAALVQHGLFFFYIRYIHRDLPIIEQLEPLTLGHKLTFTSNFPSIRFFNHNTGYGGILETSESDQESTGYSPPLGIVETLCDGDNPQEKKDYVWF